MYCPRCDRFFNQHSPTRHIYDLPKPPSGHDTYGQFVYCPAWDVWIDTTGKRKNILSEEIHQDAIYWGYVNDSVEQLVPQI